MFEKYKMYIGGGTPDQEVLMFIYIYMMAMSEDWSAR